MTKPRKVHDPLKRQVDGICLRVSHERERHGKTQRQLSAEIGANQNFIHQIESGRGPTSAALKWVRLAEALGVTVQWLLTGHGEKER